VKDEKSRRSGIFGRRQEGEPGGPDAGDSTTDPAATGQGGNGSELWFEEPGQGDQASPKPPTVAQARRAVEERRAAERRARDRRAGERRAEDGWGEERRAAEVPQARDAAAMLTGDAGAERTTEPMSQSQTDPERTRQSPTQQLPDHEPPGNGRASWPQFWFEDRPTAHDVAGVTAEPVAAPTAAPRERPDGATPPPGPAAPAAVGDSERPRAYGPVEAFVRHPVLTLLPVVLLVAVAGYIGLARDPVYTAKARVNVGRTDVPAYVLQNVVGGNQALAASYARVISTEKVVRDAARRAHVAPAKASSRLDASPIPGSTLIQVEGTGPNNDDAVALANAGSQALIAYVTRVTRDRESAAALKRYKEAQARVQKLLRRVRSLFRQGSSRLSDLSRAQVDFEAAKLRASNLANLYRATTADRSTSPLTLIAPASSASSDRATTLERLALIGLAGGLVLGLALALLRANRGRLRAMRE
jgi:hypothetical protein